MFGKVEEDMTALIRARLFFAVHWRGTLCFIAPIILIAILAPFPPKTYQWCGYTLALMAVYWLTECVPLEITSFMPVLLFPLTGVMTTSEVCKSYMNDIILMLLGVLFLAYALEQCGICKRFAYCLMSFGYKSHTVMLFVIFEVTLLISAFIPNTATTALMIPIVLNVLKIFEYQGVMKIYETDPKGEKIASDITTCYCCSVSYAATLGGVMTLTGTATNLAFKGLFQVTYPDAPEQLTFLNFLLLSFIAAWVSSLLSFLYMIIMYLGVFRGASDSAKKAVIPKKASDAIKKAILDERKKIGKFTFWEGMTIALFALAVLLFLFRYPIFFTGWGDKIASSFYVPNQYVRDSAAAISVCVAMFILPATLEVFKNCTAKVHEDLPKAPVTSVLNWTSLNSAIPFSFIFLLGGGFALCDGAMSSGLDEKMGEFLKNFKDLPTIGAIFLIMFIVMIITNFSSNVVVANLACPIAMRLGKEMGLHPLWFCMAAGYAASFCFILPIGTPGNLIAYRAANIPLKKMMIAGIGPTVITLLLFWLDMTYAAPKLIENLDKLPDWAKSAEAST